MSGTDWSREEVEAIVDDYFSMLASELAGTPFNKAAHNRALASRLNGRTKGSIEFKYANISAALMEAGFQRLTGYKPRSNYQGLLAEVIAGRIGNQTALHEIAAADADRPMTVPEVDDILAVLTHRPAAPELPPRAAESTINLIRSTTNYIEREARNRSLGNAGELFAINYERARLIHSGHERLAARIEHTSRVRGDYEGYDILSFEESGQERLIEVKTTKYPIDTPFFVSRNEVNTSERRAAHYHVYRLYDFRSSPHLYTLSGAINRSCRLSAATFSAMPA